MAIIVSVASGKGGVGKSVVASNLALLLARRGKQVVLADLDVGGANLHVLFGLFHPSRTLTDFLAKRVETLDAVAQPLDAHPGLRLLPGTGETLATANMPFAKKKRLIRHLKELPADIVVVDVGAGTGYHALDFFLMGDAHLAVATADPTSVLDLYRFIKLAAIRRVLSAFLARDEIAEVLSDRDFASVEEVLEAAGKTGDAGRSQAADMLQGFRPCLILNRMSGRSRVNTLQLKNLLQSYVGGDLAMLGEIPEDEAVEQSVRRYLPVVDHGPQSPAADAFNRLTDALLLELRGKSSQ
ncbi:MAG: flagellar biosynthesis protein FlhG [bacterium]|nr:MAG: flagellar biosynthesis protein FlhG [bacterium]